MRKFYLLCTLVLTTLVCSISAQDFSNKGKNFWVSYPEHINGTGSLMGLYLTSNVTTTGVISVNGTNINFIVTANTITTIFLGTGGSAPNTYIHMGGIQDGIKTNAAVHITAQLPIVVYAHIINAARSGATLVLPTNVWGKEYFVPSYANNGGSGGGMGYGEINIMAALPNTIVEITPSITTRNGTRPAGVPYQITLTNPGDVYQVQFPQNTDLSGTKIKSVASGGGGCQPIAVISATTWTAINCGSGNGGDNFYQQLFPSGAWGKNFITTPLKRVITNPSDNNVDVIRVYVKDPATVITKDDNGIVTTLTGLITPGNYYQYTAFRPTLLNADRPVQVIQYVLTQACSSPQTPSDPEMIALSAIEQTINDITVYSAFNNLVPGGNSQITTHYINVTMKTANTGTFRINGNIPSSPFNVIPGTIYSFLKQNVPTGGSPISRLTADSGFNAIAYGFGNVESYGYNAGTNVKDLYQQIGVSTQYGIEPTPSVCTGAPFRFKVSLPYCADSIRWDLSQLPGPPSPSSVLTQYTTCNPPPATGGPDSTTVVNGITLYWYSLPSLYTINVNGTFPVTIFVYKSTADDCGNEQEINFDLQVTDPPVAGFTWIPPNCVAEPVQFQETTPQTPKPTYYFWWDFGDPASGSSNNSNLRNPVHTFSGPGTYNVRFVDITTPGCLSDTIEHLVTIAPMPTATISGTTGVCINTTPEPLITFTGTGGTAPYTFTYNINGGPTQTITTSSGNSVTVSVPTSVTGPFQYNLLSVASNGSLLCTQTQAGSAIVTIGANATINLTSASNTNAQTVCVNNAITDITYSIGSGGTGATVSGLPPGVTGVFNAGVFTITGTPTVPGTFAYTVNTTGGCIQTSSTGSITVNADAAISLTSGTGSNIQSVCINTAISNISYNITGGGTGGTVTGLPAGVNGVFSGGILTINGTPTVTGTFNYTINTTGNCIQTSATGTITVNPDATISLSSAGGSNNQTLCINIAISNITYALGGAATGAVVSGLPTGVTGSYSGGVFTISGTPTVTGTFNYTVTASGNCAQNTASGTITVNPDAAISLTSAMATTSQTLCINTPITNITYAISGGGTGGNVTGLPAGVTGTFSGGVLTISGTPTVAGTFNYTVSTTGTCLQGSMIGSITVNPDATISLSSGAGSNNQSLCINIPISNITYALGGAATGATVTGLPAGVTGSYSGGVFTISGTPTVAGAFNYTVTTNGTCGLNTANGTITVNPNAAINLTSSPSSAAQSVCINTAIIDITYAISGGGTSASVTGLPAGVTGSFSAGVFTITGSPTVNGVFNYTVTTSGNCVQTNLSGTITVSPNATLNLTSGAGTATQTICINTALVNITYSVAGSGTGGTVTGLPAGVTGNYSGGVFTISGIPTVSGVFNYTINTTGSCGQANANGTITVNADATLNLTSAGTTTSQERCINSAITDITYSVGGGGTGATISGLPAGITGVYNSGVVTISGTPTVSGIFNYTVITMGPCVQRTATGTITVNALPTGNFNFTIPSCETRTISFTDLSVPNSGVVNTWAWNFGDPGSGGNNTSTLQNPVHTYATTGTYTVTLTVTTDKGCVSTLYSNTITVNARPAAGFIAPEVCLTDIFAPFIDTSSIATGSIVAWNWNFGDPFATIPNPNTSTLQNPTHTYTVVGPYTVQLIATSNNGCKDTISQSFVVNGSIPVAGFNLQNPTGLCSNQDVRITDNSTVDFGSLVKVEIYWDYLNDPTNKTTDDFPTPGELYTHTYPEFGAPLTKTYQIRYVAYSGINCLNTFTRDITVLATPSLQFNPIPFVCSDAPAFQVTQAQLTNGLPGGPGVFSGPGISSTGLFTPQLAGVGVHTIRYTYTGTNGCSNYKEQTITVYATPPVNAGPDKVVLEGGQVTLTPALGFNQPVTYLWTPPTGLADPTIAFAVASPATDMIYTLTVTTAQGCKNSDMVSVKVLKAPLIPNIFSPNGDGIHDRWDIAFLESYPGCTIDIYNRYGQLIYHSVGYAKPWDGTVNGKPVPVGTYYYIVNPKNGRQQYSGYVDVIR